MPPPGTLASAVLVHATAVASGSACILLMGPSGSGKTDLALRLIAWPPTGLELPLPAFQLLSDDQVLITRDESRLIARPPPTIAGRIEVRGVGIVPIAHTAEADVRLVVELVPPQAVERMPDDRTVTIAQTPVPALALSAFEQSAPLKVALALRQVLARTAQS